MHAKKSQQITRKVLVAAVALLLASGSCGNGFALGAASAVALEAQVSTLSSRDATGDADAEKDPEAGEGEGEDGGQEPGTGNGEQEPGTGEGDAEKDPEAGEGDGSEGEGDGSEGEEPGEGEDDAVTAPVATLYAQAHRENYGWDAKASAVSTSASASDTTIGDAAVNVRLEALKLYVDVDGAHYPVYMTAHVQNKGWLKATSAVGDMAGSTGEGLRIEALTLELPKELASTYTLYYRAYVEGKGWLDWTTSGNQAGSEGLGLKLVALEVRVVASGTPELPEVGTQALVRPVLITTSHVQNVGWISSNADANNHVILGTQGQGLRLEAFTLATQDLDGVNVAYEAHVSYVGWQGEKAAGVTAGTQGKGYAVEAVRFKLTGENASNYTLYYRAHVAYLGWLDWTSDYESAGTAGFGRRVEAVELLLVPAGTQAPGNTKVSFIDAATSQSLIVSTLGAGQSAWQTVGLGQTAGSTGLSRGLTGFSLAVPSTSAIEGSVNYIAHFSNVGWVAAQVNGAQSYQGGNTIEAIQLALHGDIANYYDLYYRAHIANYGWMGWTSNAGLAGSSGLGRQLEAFEVRLVLKGDGAPGSTANSYSDANGFLKPKVVQQVSAAHAKWVSTARSYGSKTAWMLLTDCTTNQTAIMNYHDDDWYVYSIIACTTGKASTPTKKGAYEVYGKGLSFGHGYTCWYYTQWSGDYLYHSVLYNEGSSTSIQDGRLGINASNGCIRLDINWARWIYNNIPYGTRVVIW
jgi:uncharacterized protein YjdB